MLKPDQLDLAFRADFTHQDHQRPNEPTPSLCPACAHYLAELAVFRSGDVESAIVALDTARDALNVFQGNAPEVMFDPGVAAMIANDLQYGTETRCDGEDLTWSAADRTAK